MSCLGNLIWFIFGGLLLSVAYMIVGILLCLTIIGIPFGYQLFKIGTLALHPFGKTTIVSDNSGSILSTVMNILWIVLGGLTIALAHLALGVLFCITIIGIPFGIQHFKLMVVALLPFGRTIIDI